MLIRPIDNRDLDALKRLWSANWHDTYGPLLGPTDAHRIDASLNDPGIASMLAEDGGGFAAIEGKEALGSICFAERGSVAYIWGMYVHPARQRAGIGTTLLRRAAGEMVRAERIELSTVSAGALAFYVHLGFAREGEGEIELFPGFRAPTVNLSVAVSALRGSHPGTLIRAMRSTST